SISRYPLLRSCDLSTSHTFFFFNDTATTEIYTLSLHDALPICLLQCVADRLKAHFPDTEQLAHLGGGTFACVNASRERADAEIRSEEHTSELQSRGHLVCRLLLEKKKETKETGCRLQPGWIVCP